MGDSGLNEWRSQNRVLRTGETARKEARCRALLYGRAEGALPPRLKSGASTTLTSGLYNAGAWASATLKSTTLRSGEVSAGLKPCHHKTASLMSQLKL